MIVGHRQVQVGDVFGLPGSSLAGLEPRECAVLRLRFCEIEQLVRLPVGHSPAAAAATTAAHLVVVGPVEEVAGHHLGI